MNVFNEQRKEDALFIEDCAIPVGNYSRTIQITFLSIAFNRGIVKRIIRRDSSIERINLFLFHNTKQIE